MNEVKGWSRIAAKPERPEDYTPARPAGPWHAVNVDTGGQVQSWCGSRLKGINRNRTASPEQPEGRACATCVRAIAQDRPRTYRR